MCGICGEIRFDGQVPDVSATIAMTRALAPRGPDGECVDVSHLDDDLLGYVVDVLRSPEAKSRNLIEPSYVDALVANDDLRFRGQGDMLWHLGVLELWLQAHGIEG
jgi:asparagine synthetase B (glutamine-hydrolysing)